MSEIVKTMSEIMAAVPAASSLDGKSVVMTDANGDMAKMNAELAFFKFKCKCLFGERKVHLKRNIYIRTYSIPQWVTYVNSITGWNVAKAESSAGDIVIVVSTTTEGQSVVLYAQCVEDGNNSNRYCKGLLLEIEGHQPYWSTYVTAL